jgi:hypothetical protein
MMIMKNRYRLVKVGCRGGIYYYDDTATGARRSLGITDEGDAERLVHAKNEADRQPALSRRMGMAYLVSADPKLAARLWDEVMGDIIQDKKDPTLHRWKTAIKDPAFDFVRKQIVVMTLPDDFMAVLRADTVSTNVYRASFSLVCLESGW